MRKRSRRNPMEFCIFYLLWALIHSNQQCFWLLAFWTFIPIGLKRLGTIYELLCGKNGNMTSEEKKLNEIRSDDSCSESACSRYCVRWNCHYYAIIDAISNISTFVELMSIIYTQSHIEFQCEYPFEFYSWAIFLLYVVWMMFSSHVFCDTMKMFELTESVMHSTMDTQMLLKCLPDSKSKAI